MFFHTLIIFLAITGALVWSYILWAMVRTFPYAFICATSVMRCQLRAMRRAKRSPTWSRLPAAFFHHFWSFLGTTPGSISLTGKDWAWRGVGDWNANAPISPIEVNWPLPPVDVKETTPMANHEDGSWPRHDRFTMSDWADQVVNGDTNQGYPAFVVAHCMDEGINPLAIFLEDADREDDILTRKDPSRTSAHLDGSYPRADWVHEVQNEDTRIGWRAWQLAQDDAREGMSPDISETQGQM